MFQHLFSVFIRRHLKNIKRIFLSIASPVVLRWLQRCIHLIDPGSCKCCVFAAGRQYTSSPVKSTGLTVILSRNVCHSGRPCQCRKHYIIRIIINIGNVPGKAETISVIFSFCHIGRPFLCKCFRIDQILCHKFMQPFDTFFVSFLNRCINHLTFICYSKMISCVPITISESIY